MSFFKQNSNAKRMNELSFIITTDIAHDEINIKSSKCDKTITLDHQDNTYLDLYSTGNIIINNYYKEILLIKKALEWMFNDTEEEYHKYININLNCDSVYAINALNEWIHKWYSTSEEEKDERPFDNELYIIYTYTKKCKIIVN